MQTSIYRTDKQGPTVYSTGFPGGSVGKKPPANAGDTGGDMGSIPPRYSCLENPTHRGAWWATVQGVTKSWTQLTEHTCTVYIELYSISCDKS